MSNLTIHRLDNNIKLKLQKQATKNGRSIEAEIKIILTKIFINEPEIKQGLATKIQQIVKKESELKILQPSRKSNFSQRQLDFSNETYG